MRAAPQAVLEKIVVSSQVDLEEYRSEPRTPSKTPSRREGGRKLSDSSLATPLASMSGSNAALRRATLQRTSTYTAAALRLQPHAHTKTVSFDTNSAHAPLA
eukprot:CAMPEP_0185834562 /NCGR_PEP_ID=MMETSP1353-20130828/5627_1 /TAXON_ID=1077150 /ORGANISM="Erythrolobus australicus, Strain CCMP3124" /LENGTH=101 /DNA_ID=CAMNT_0028533019 /DNA_START=63 /DNA_END=369 /DNA_ORIENTATION=+